METATCLAPMRGGPSAGMGSSARSSSSSLLDAICCYVWSGRHAAQLLLPLQRQLLLSSLLPASACALLQHLICAVAAVGSWQMDIVVIDGVAGQRVRAIEQCPYVALRLSRAPGVGTPPAVHALQLSQLARELDARIRLSAHLLRSRRRLHHCDE